MILDRMLLYFQLATMSLASPPSFESSVLVSAYVQVCPCVHAAGVRCDPLRRQSSDVAGAGQRIVDFRFIGTVFLVHLTRARRYRGVPTPGAEFGLFLTDPLRWTRCTGAMLQL